MIKELQMNPNASFQVRSRRQESIAWSKVTPGASRERGYTNTRLLIQYREQWREAAIDVAYLRQPQQMGDQRNHMHVFKRWYSRTGADARPPGIEDGMHFGYTGIIAMYAD